jgi:NAD(P)-dependent dehydrogenase (short-subunit alcohol dehydrogenase family)
MLDYQPATTVLQERVILVTGAGDGIGREAALSYAAHGATVILLGKTVSKLEETYDLILAAGGAEPAIVPLDLQGAAEQHYADLATTIAEQFGRLDGLLNNAGILGVLSPFEQIDLESWEAVLKVNVTAQMQLTKALLPLLKKADDSAIIFTSSGVGKKGRAYWGSYAVSKFATEGMMQLLADELSNTSVRVNSINPGATRTSMRASAYPGEDANKLKTPSELMPVYLYLMSPDSAQYRGQSIDAQG